jgi:hypothetical protein
MSGRHNHHRKKKKSRSHSAAPESTEKVLCQEHPDNEREDDMKQANNNPSIVKSPHWLWLATPIAISLFALGAYVTQAYYTRKAMRVDQRGWISVPFPNSWPTENGEIFAITAMVNSGKTPARITQIDTLATVFKKGEDVPIGDFSVGHPHDRIHTPTVIFPTAPAPLRQPISEYGLHSKTPINADDTLRKDISNGDRFILFFGKVAYNDVFGVEHFTQFCTGNGEGISSEVLIKCLAYNDIDSNEE